MVNPSINAIYGDAFFMAFTPTHDLQPTIDLAALGEGNFLTYIREVSLGDTKGWAVCTDEGVQLAIFSSPEAAYFSARQFNLTPSSVH